MIYIFKFSGGKDSLATLLTGINTLPRESIRIAFCDTGWEHPDTYTYIDKIGEMLGMPITTLRNPKYPKGMPDLVKARKRFPATRARFCTDALKVQPGIDFVLAQTEDVAVYQGVRAEESESRRMLKRNDEYFKFYFEPFRHRGKYDKKIKTLKKRMAKAKIGKGQTDMFEHPLAEELREIEQKNIKTLKPVFHSYRRKDVIKWCDKYSADVIRPIIHWTATEVITYCLEQGYPLNPLYYRASKRVGCYPCINSSLQEIAIISENDPWRIDEIRELEREVGGGASFFANDKIPAAFHTGSWADANSDNTATVNTIDDVVAYVTRNRKDAELLDKQTTHGCISHYNICENR